MRAAVGLHGNACECAGVGDVLEVVSDRLRLRLASLDVPKKDGDWVDGGAACVVRRTMTRLGRVVVVVVVVDVVVRPAGISLEFLPSVILTSTMPP